MNKKFVLILLVVGLIGSCEKQSPCDVLVNGVYQFPELPENHNMTSQEVTEFWDLPENICNCITTEGLIETIMNYPELRLITAGANPQSGYNLLVRERFRGSRELESRPDRATYLLEKYKTLDPFGYNQDWEPAKIGAFIFYINDFELIISQYVNLEPLTGEERIELIEKVLSVYEKKKSNSDKYSTWSLSRTMVIASRMMKLSDFSPFMLVYIENNAVWEVNEYYYPVTYETLDIIYNLSIEYLDNLKNK
ncbi:hypothetical protein LR002_03015 [Candidatus Gracilibacteria bacterium]|nr:hypothetical protein [Candidatus Gracilibacteria bacterium]